MVLGLFGPYFPMAAVISILFTRISADTVVPGSTEGAAASNYVLWKEHGTEEGHLRPEQEEADKFSESGFFSEHLFSPYYSPQKISARFYNFVFKNHPCLFLHDKTPGLFLIG